MTTREASSIQEKHIAKILNGKVTPNSGGTKFGGGDVLTDNFLIEAKTSLSEKDSFSIKRAWLKKAAEQAFEQGKRYYALAFNYSYAGDNYYIVDERLFKKVIANIEEEESNV